MCAREYLGVRAYRCVAAGRWGAGGDGVTSRTVGGGSWSELNQKWRATFGFWRCIVKTQSSGRNLGHVRPPAKYPSRKPQLDPAALSRGISRTVKRDRNFVPNGFGELKRPALSGFLCIARIECPVARDCLYTDPLLHQKGAGYFWLMADPLVGEAGTL